MKNKKKNEDKKNEDKKIEDLEYDMLGNLFIGNLLDISGDLDNTSQSLLAYVESDEIKKVNNNTK